MVSIISDKYLVLCLFVLLFIISIASYQIVFSDNNDQPKNKDTSTGIIHKSTGKVYYTRSECRSDESGKYFWLVTYDITDAKKWKLATGKEFNPNPRKTTQPCEDTKDTTYDPSAQGTANQLTTHDLHCIDGHVIQYTVIIYLDGWRKHFDPVDFGPPCPPGSVMERTRPDDGIPSQNGSHGFNNKSTSMIIPPWIKFTGDSWQKGVISDNEFASAMGYLVKEKIIHTNLQLLNNGELLISKDIQIPGWIKDTAKWWAEDTIDDQTFVNSIEFMINEKIINLQSNPTTCCPSELQPNQRVPISNVRILDANGNDISTIYAGDTLKITADLTNPQSHDQGVAYAIQISDIEGVVIFYDTLEEYVKSGNTDTFTTIWTPETDGTYQILITNWETWDNPIALSSPYQKSIVVMPSR